MSLGNTWCRTHHVALFNELFEPGSIGLAAERCADGTCQRALGIRRIVVGDKHRPAALDELLRERVASERDSINQCDRFRGWA